MEDIVEGSVDIDIASYSCWEGAEIEVSFQGVAWDQPLFTIDVAELTGPKSFAQTVSEDEAGGIMLAPIPSNLFRTIETAPQFQLLTADVPALCYRNCSFVPSLVTTPQIYECSGSKWSSFLYQTAGCGGENQEIVTITGSLLGDNWTSTVLIGDLSAEILSYSTVGNTETETISFTIPDMNYGTYDLSVANSLYGFSSPNVTFYVPLVIDGLYPSVAALFGGTEMSILGNFGNLQILPAIAVNGTKVDIIKSNETVIQFIAPASLGSNLLASMNVTFTFRSNETVFCSQSLNCSEVSHLGVLEDGTDLIEFDILDAFYYEDKPWPTIYEFTPLQGGAGGGFEITFSGEFLDMFHVIEGCGSNCYGSTCSSWMQLETYNCSILESEFGCECSGCDCGAISGGNCENDCFWSYDGQCDDGGQGSAFSLCGYGSDCSDCGSRESIDLELEPLEPMTCSGTRESDGISFPWEGLECGPFDPLQRGFEGYCENDDDECTLSQHSCKCYRENADRWYFYSGPSSGDQCAQLLCWKNIEVYYTECVWDAKTVSTGNWNLVTNTVTLTSDPSALCEPSQWPAISISIGSDATCEIINMSATELVCHVSSAVRPGSVDIEIYYADRGYADFQIPNQFNFLLSVFSVSPNRGSIFGGQTILITGEGFGSNASQTEVILGNSECEDGSSDTYQASSSFECETFGCDIVAINDNNISCVVRSAQTRFSHKFLQPIDIFQPIE